MRRKRRISRRAATRSPAARIVIVTEGESTEPAYLRTFGRVCGEPSAVRPKIIPAAGDPRAVVERAIVELRKLRGDKLASRDSVWAMFDRDEHPRFAEAKILARDNGISMAISNPCFELWGIFHYRDYDAPLDRHESQRQLARLCSTYVSDRGKLFDDPEIIRDNYADARQRAETSLTRRLEEGTPEGNPSTTVHRLTERIRLQQ